MHEAVASFRSPSWGPDGPWQLSQPTPLGRTMISQNEATGFIHARYMAAYAFGVFGFIPSIERSISNGMMGGAQLCASCHDIGYTPDRLGIHSFDQMGRR